MQKQRRAKAGQSKAKAMQKQSDSKAKATQSKRKAKRSKSKAKQSETESKQNQSEAKQKQSKKEELSKSKAKAKAKQKQRKGNIYKCFAFCIPRAGWHVQDVGGTTPGCWGNVRHGSLRRKATSIKRIVRTPIGHPQGVP